MLPPGLQNVEVENTVSVTHVRSTFAARLRRSTVFLPVSEPAQISCNIIGGCCFMLPQTRILVGARWKMTHTLHWRYACRSQPNLSSAATPKLPSRLNLGMAFKEAALPTGKLRIATHLRGWGREPGAQNAEQSFTVCHHTGFAWPQGAVIVDPILNMTSCRHDPLPK